MALQENDLLLIQRGNDCYKTTLAELRDWLAANPFIEETDDEEPNPS